MRRILPLSVPFRRFQPEVVERAGYGSIRVTWRPSGRGRGCAGAVAVAV